MLRAYLTCAKFEVLIIKMNNMKNYLFSWLILFHKNLMVALRHTIRKMLVRQNIFLAANSSCSGQPYHYGPAKNTSELSQPAGGGIQ